MMHDADPCADIDIVEREAAAFGGLLVAGPLGTPVPSCPGWTMAELAGHLGGIHRWAAQAVRSGPAGPPPSAGSPGAEPAAGESPAELAQWFGEGAAALVATLRDCDPDQPCWTFAPPHTARFWMRRQAHETTMHRWDAANALGGRLGSAGRIDEEVALDGIDEVLGVFLPRQVRLGRMPARPEVAELVTTAGRSMVLATDAAPVSAATARIEGPAEALLLLLWRRTGLDDPRLSVTGSLDDIGRLLAGPLTP